MHLKAYPGDAGGQDFKTLESFRDGFFSGETVRMQCAHNETAATLLIVVS